MRFYSLLFGFMLVAQVVSAQKKAIISGKVVDENDAPLQSVSVQILNKQNGTVTNKDGNFSISIISKKAIALVFSFTGYKNVQRNFLLNIGGSETVFVKLERQTNQLQQVTVTDTRERREAGRIAIDAQKGLVNPSPIGGIESLIKYLLVVIMS